MYAVGFQRHSKDELRGLFDKLQARRELGGIPLVNLDMIAQAIVEEKVYAPAQIMTLIELAQKELSGHFAILEACDRCRGTGRVYCWKYLVPGVVETVIHAWNPCPMCLGAKNVLSKEARDFTAFMDPEQLQRARKKISLSAPDRFALRCRILAEKRYVLHAYIGKWRWERQNVGMKKRKTDKRAS